MKKQIILNDRDILVFRFLEKYRIGASRNIFLACGFSSIDYASVRLKKLCEYGYIKRHLLYFGVPFFFTLTRKGLNVLDNKSKAYLPSHSTALHYLGVADIVAFLSNKYSLNIIEDIFVDRDFFNKGIFKKYRLNLHKPDIIFNNDDILFFVEYERTRKKTSRIINNITANSLVADKQIWFIDNIRLDSIKKEYQDENTFFCKYSDVIFELKKIGGVKEK